MAFFEAGGLINFFSPIFTFLLVYAVAYGIFISRKPFGENTGVYALISAMLGFFTVLSPPVRAFLEYVTPWFLALAVVFMLIVISISVFTEVKWMKVIADPTARTWLIIIVVLIVVGGASAVFGQSALEAQVGAQAVPVTNENGEIIDASGQLGQAGTATGDYEANLINTLVHPQVLGVLLIFGLSALIIYFLSRPAGGL